MTTNMTTAEKCANAGFRDDETKGVLALEKLGAKIDLVHLFVGYTLRTATAFGSADRTVVKLARTCGVQVNKGGVLAPLAFVFSSKIGG